MRHNAGSSSFIHVGGSFFILILFLFEVSLPVQSGAPFLLGRPKRVKLFLEILVRFLGKPRITRLAQI
jgi:hypothetical protein